MKSKKNSYTVTYLFWLQFNVILFIEKETHMTWKIKQHLENGSAVLEKSEILRQLGKDEKMFWKSNIRPGLGVDDVGLFARKLLF